MKETARQRLEDLANCECGRPRTFGSFSRITCSLLRALTRVPVIIPYYHLVSDIDVPHVKHLHRQKNIREFRSDLDFILTNYSPIGLHTLLEHANSGRRLPPRACLLTFDDGYSEMSNVVAPILHAKGVSATFFVTSAFVDNAQLCYLNKASLLIEELIRNRSSGVEGQLTALLRSRGAAGEDLKSEILSIGYAERSLLDEMAGMISLNFAEYLLKRKPYLTAAQIEDLIRGGFTIGAHSVDHPLFSAISIEEQVRQTIDSVRYVRDRFSLSYGVFAFPHNDDGVSREMFRRITDSGLVDLSFGTSGILNDSVPNHLQRFSLEKPLKPAHRILAFQYARRVSRLIAGKSVVTRV
jgi:peptidoglycan/xylan/chitin deacetylase (PgdA/CDA1 family)